MNLLHLVRESPLTLKEIATRSGVNKNTIQAWLYQGKAPSFYNLEAVLNVIGYRLKLEKINE